MASDFDKASDYIYSYDLAGHIWDNHPGLYLEGRKAQKRFILDPMDSITNGLAGLQTRWKYKILAEISDGD